MSAFHIECWNRLHPESPRVGFNAKFASRCSASACDLGGMIAIGAKMWGTKAEDGWGRFNNRPNGKPLGQLMDDIKRKQEREQLMQSTPIPFKAGDEVVCINNIGTTLVVNQTYTVESMHNTASGWEVKLANNNAAWSASRFMLLKDQPLNVNPETGEDIPQSTNVDEMVNKAADSVVSKMAPIVANLVKDTVDKKLDRVTMISAIATEVLAKVTPQLTTTIEVKNLDTGKTQSLGIQHRQFPLLLKTVQARVPVWMAGPSGSGKTTAAMNVADALSLQFRYSGAVGDPYALIGYKDANGRYVRTEFREAYENGGLFLWDEVDASDPNALLAFNAALANGTCPFPDGTIKQHPDCVMIAAANTWGHGATQEYVGRLKMDAAFLKRFAFIAWDYDERMELNTAPNRTWTMRVQKVRKAVRDSGLRVLVTPRESYIGAKLLAVGIDQDTVEAMTIKSGMTDEQWQKVRYA